MKGTEGFKKVMREYLEKRGSKDPLFARIVTKPGKNMTDCITYITNQVKILAQGDTQIGLSDDEVYSMAIHYFSEDVIDIGKPMNNVTVVSNRKIELTEEEKLQARKEAIEQLKNETIEKMRKKPEKAKPEEKNAVKPNDNTLFVV